MLYCYAVFDDKTSSYQNPFFSVSDGAAVRIFTSGIRTPGTVLNEYPSDFKLYKVGEFDDVGGFFRNTDTNCVPVFLVAGSSCLSMVDSNFDKLPQEKE